MNFHMVERIDVAPTADLALHDSIIPSLTS